MDTDVAGDAAAILQLALLMAWTVLSQIHKSQINCIYHQIFTDRGVFDEVVSTITLSFAPGLFQVLTAAESPSLQFFKSLPTPTVDCWAIYLVVMEKAGARPRVYIGSSTALVGGVLKRFRQYEPTCTWLPKNVGKSYEEGFNITHKGLLIWATTPSAVLLPRLRLLFILLEATFSFVFWTMYTTKRDYGMGYICPWGWNSLDYDGLCSHCALNEKVLGDFNLSKKELAKQEELRVAKKHEYDTNYRIDQRKNNAAEFYARSRKSLLKHRTEKHD